MIRLDRAAVLALVASLALAGAAAAQETPPPGPSPMPSPADDGRPVLSLTLDDAVRRTLENNVDIAVERFNPESSELGVDELKGGYEPVLTSSVTQNSAARPATNVFAGAESIDTDTLNYNVGAAQNLPTGGSFRVDFTNRRSSTNSVFESFNPSYNSNFNLNFSQPFLRNFSTDATRTQIKVAKKNREISDVQFRQTVVNTVASVKQSYYDLLYAIDNLVVQRKSLALAGKFLEENQIKVRVGTMAPLDVVAAESEQASREEFVIVAEAAVAETEDALKRAMFNTNDPEMWNTRIVPVDRPTFEPVRVDAAAATRTAIEKRTDIVAARKGLESADYNVAYAKNQLLPNVDFVAAYGTTGTGGTFFEREGFGGPIITTVPGGYNDAISDVFGRDFPTWQIGVNFAYPIFNRQGRASHARAQVSRDQGQANIRRLEMQIAGEVRSAARAVETNLRRVESTRAARVLQERRLDAETKKFAAGMSTNFLVTQSQRDLAVAEVAELRAIADYRKSLVNFERVQEAGLGGGGGTATVSTSSGSRSRTGTTTSTGTSANQSGDSFQ